MSLPGCSLDHWKVIEVDGKTTQEMFMRIEIDNYSVNILNDPSGDSFIMLSGSDSPQGAMYRVRLNFTASTDNLNLQQNGDFVEVLMNIDLLQPAIDVLRNEKPLFFSWSTISKIAILSTSKEPVGDAEV